MSNILTSKGLVFTGSELSQPRMYVEQEKLKRYFNGWKLHATGGSINSARGVLKTTYGESYNVTIKIPEGYPYRIPSIEVTNIEIRPNCPHRYGGGDLCVMKPDQWTSNYSLAFMVAKTTIWLHKYDFWKRKGRWPGNQQHHGLLGFLQDILNS